MQEMIRSGPGDITFGQNYPDSVAFQILFIKTFIVNLFNLINDQISAFELTSNSNNQYYLII